MKKQNRIIIILGKVGSGKSTLARLLFKKLEKRCIVLDPMAEYTTGIIFTSFPDLLEYMKANWNKQKMRLICRFKSIEEYEQAILLIREVKQFWIIVEELNWFLDAYAKHDALLELVRFGRHDNISMIFIAQRAAEIPKLFTSQANFIISFRQTEPRDLDYLSKVGLIGTEGVARLSTLPVLTDYKDLSDKNYIIFGS